MVDAELAAHGGSIIEIRKVQGRWQVVSGSPFARRIDALGTRIALSGPAAGHPGSAPRRTRAGAPSSAR
jgi:uncharacterized protein